MGRSYDATGQVAGATRRADCDPTTCPCQDGVCTLSRYARAAAVATHSGRPTLGESERAVAKRIEGVPVDMDAMAAVAGVHRAASAVRNHLERTVLAPYDLTWTAWTVLWVVWVWGDIETRHVAEEAGISKPTLTGVLRTLESRGLLRRRTHPDDARRVLVHLTTRGARLMGQVLPRFNAEEVRVTESLTTDQTQELARGLRAIVVDLEHLDH
ncbi:MAG TPA: MarR family winged helix-turn-helix transcriptional regulator [Candidatus Nanopelagicales bacterium]|nr:MarR family winged helix-turn-helix transcriptional regulator [Candidatus Nanopelagicales bacterium]